MELEKLDYQKILRLTKKSLNETPANSEKFRELYDLCFKVECKVKKFDLHNVSGAVWVVQDTMSGMIAGMFDNQQKAIKYANGSANMAITNMEVI